MEKLNGTNVKIGTKTPQKRKDIMGIMINNKKLVLNFFDRKYKHNKKDNIIKFNFLKLNPRKYSDHLPLPAKIISVQDIKPIRNINFFKFTLILNLMSAKLT